MPSGPKKRKAAKRKMKSLGVTTTMQQGSGGSDSGSEISSPMSPDVGQFDGMQGKEDGGGELETGRTGGDVVNEENGDENVVVEEKESIIPEKSAVDEAKVDDVAPASSHDEASVSDTTALVPISQPEVVNVEHVDPEKEVSPLAPEVKEKLENPVPIIVEQPVPISSEEKEVAAQADIHVEKVEPLAFPIDKTEEMVENSRSGNTPYDEVEEKDEIVGSQQLPSCDKEDRGEVLGSIKRPGEKGEDNEASRSLRPPANKEEEKVVRFSDSKFAEQPTEGHNEPVQTESRAIGTEVYPSPQAVPRASWLNCCGLFDAFVGSNV